MPARPKSTMTAVMLTVGLLGLFGMADTQAANPLGRYKDAKMNATLKLNPIGSERVALRDGTVKVKRREVRATLVDTINNRQVKLAMGLTTEVQNVTDQIVTIGSGDVRIKDIATGAPVASGGEFVRGKFRIRRKDDADRTWIIKQDQRIKVREISGLLTGITKGTLKAKR